MCALDQPIDWNGPFQPPVFGPSNDQSGHFLPPGVAYTTGLSHNPLHGARYKTGKNAYAKK